MNEDDSRKALGIFFILVFDFLAAGKAVYVGHLVQGVPPLFVAFWTFGITSIFFLLLQTPRLDQLKAMVTANFRHVALVNLTTAMAWLTYFYALKHLEPAIDTGIAFAVPPFMTVLL